MQPGVTLAQAYVTCWLKSWVLGVGGVHTDSKVAISQPEPELSFLKDQLGLVGARRGGKKYQM